MTITADYIERSVAKDELLSWAVCIKHPKHLLKEDAMCVLDAIPVADVVSRVAFDQVCWERDVAIEQLNSYGVSFGEKAELAPVMHGRREDVSYYKAKNGILYRAKRCSVCHTDSRRKHCCNFCKNCGAKMDLEVIVDA